MLSQNQVRRFSYLQFDTLSDARLLSLFQAGDIASFEALFLRHYKRVYGILFRLLGNQAEAEDIAQDVFLKLYHSPKQISLDDEIDLIGWLYRVAVNQGYNALRSRKRRNHWQERFAQLWPFGNSSPEPTLYSERRDTQSEVRQIMAQMKARDAQLLLLRHSGLSYKELAVVFKVSPNSIGSLLIRAEKQFAKKYRKIFGEGG